MKGRFLVIEGLDGCGKSTQVELLKENLERQGVKYKFIHFPMLNKGVYGELVAEFLRGEFGSLDQVHPKLVALLFANDRKEHIEVVKGWIDQGYYVLADRYVYSNIAFQCAKLTDAAQKESLRKWIFDFEFGTNGLPRPDKTLFLNVPFHFIEKSLSKAREGEDRDYLNGKDDIHEKSLNLQQDVYKEYLNLISRQADFVAIDCSDAAGNFLPKDRIHQLILQQLEG